jgi:DNA topoisomerase-1
MCKRSEMRSASDAERKKLGVPPAYTNVMVAVDPKADLVATALTPKGKTFYLYSKAFRARQDAKKYARVARLVKKADEIEARIDRDCLNPAGDDYHVAMTARLILLTGLRNGNPAQGEKESYGASSLLLEHCVDNQDELRLVFPGKHGVMQSWRITNERGLMRERPRSSRIPRLRRCAT